MVKWVVLAILLLPFVEFGVFALVAAQIGVLWALGLTLATSMAGFLLLTLAGRSRLIQLRMATAKSDLAAFQAMAGGLALVLGGLLLLLPGFVTDTLGIVVLLGLLGPVRHWSGALFRRVVGTARQRRPDGVVDLAEDEWRRVPEPRLEHRHHDDHPGDTDRPPDPNRTG